MAQEPNEGTANSGVQRIAALPGTSASEAFPHEPHNRVSPANGGKHDAATRTARRSLGRLRLIAIVAPLVFAIGLGLLTEEVLVTFIGRPLSHTVASLILTCAIVLFATWIFRALDRMTTELQARAECQRRDAEAIARMREREHIGIELHDGVIQSLYGVQLKLEAGIGVSESQRAAGERLDEAIDALTDVAAQMRRYIFALRPSLGGPDDLARALQDLLHDVQANSGIQTELTIREGSLDGLGTAAPQLAFDMVRQAVAVARQRGATYVRLSVDRDGGGLHIEVRDNRERANQVELLAGDDGLGQRMNSAGATLSYLKDERGTLLAAFVPVAAPADSSRLPVCTPATPLSASGSRSPSSVNARSVSRAHSSDRRLPELGEDTRR